MSEDVAKRLKQQAKTFKALQKLFRASGDFDSMLEAAICAGLAEVAEGLAEIAEEVRRRT